MTVQLVCASHSPLAGFPTAETDRVLAADAAMAARAAAIQEFDPELVVQFGPDHYGGRHMDCMPCFCIGRSATALDDVGGTPGRLDVPAGLAADLLGFVREEGIDAAWSHEMEVDHGFSQGLQRLCGGVATYPVIPVFIDCIAPPFVPFRRSRLLGEAVGRWVAQRDERILVIGTGGLTHNPDIFFPPVDVAPEETRPYLIHGTRQEELPRDEWLKKSDEAHRAIAPFLADAGITDESLHIHEDWDREFLQLLAGGDLEAVDAWQPNDIMQRLGIGTLEVHMWIAACAAASAAGCPPPVIDHYAPTKELGIGFGVLHASSEES
ncbi:DODA-type extradiol aromatic ring-opening family dioxygenase [Streptomyces pseudovenezuelae]|uniref:DODA-type extradiol aromatic ring-opening family dioxygenase n=1 Tax=Streptomyces pseudovenezuelae TaxID=67350 RepID=UPI0036EE5229